MIFIAFTIVEYGEKILKEISTFLSGFQYFFFQSHNLSSNFKMTANKTLVTNSYILQVLSIELSLSYIKLIFYILYFGPMYLE